ncbi:serine/threonine protein phosphatase [Halobacteriales archaeon QS_8_69_26]|nr:MAG: serine/threonine protein phosphatase [Halobacteriales archaeon QS_8_69_26]
MVDNVAGLMGELEGGDFYLLSGVEQGMRFSEWVDRGKLPEFAGLDPEDIDYRLERCLKRELIEKKTIQYEGYRLTFEGYDALALHTLSERDTIDAVGAPLGVGKESDVYEVRSYKPMALKYHREGITNFREVRRGRSYTSDREHVSDVYTARKAAEREYETLRSLYPEVSVPRPVDHNRHAIVMEKMEGVELSRAELQDGAVTVLDAILRELAAAHDEGWVHADMSEYNVFVRPDGVTLFDWPQAVETGHENAGELLERDVSNAVGYFRRKHPDETPEVDERAVAEAISEGAFASVRELS